MESYPVTDQIFVMASATNGLSIVPMVMPYDGMLIRAHISLAQTSLTDGDGAQAFLATTNDIDSFGVALPQSNSVLAHLVSTVNAAVGGAYAYGLTQVYPLGRLVVASQSLYFLVNSGIGIVTASCTVQLVKHAKAGRKARYI